MSINPSETISEGLLHNAVVLDYLEVLALSQSLSYVYIEIIEKLTLRFSAEYELPSDALRVIIRSAIVPITHCFFERLIRLNKVVNSSNSKLSISEEEFFPTPNTIADFQNRTANSIKFNQSVFVLLSEVWKLEKVPGNNVYELNLTQPPSFKNHLFQLSKSKFNLINILKLIERFTQWIPAFGRLPVLSFTNSENALHRRFFYLNFFKKVHYKEPQVLVNVDLDARDKLFNKTQLELSEVSGFLSDHGFSDNQKSVITKLFLNFLKLSFPLQCLEGLQNNLKEAKMALVPFKVSALLFSGSMTMNSLFIIGVAKSMGFKIINIQHGGHYGYQLDNSSFLETEWALNDEFLTWGWKELPNHPAIKNLKTQSMPSPWLSERKLYWKDLVVDGPKKFDVLWMPHALKQFTHSPPAVYANRLENINEFSDSMIDFITNAVKSKIKVYCKPFNPVTVDLMADTYRSMGEIGGDFFECSDRFDKGMNYDLLETSSIVLWDQPGTGFMECIASGIPTMILWAPYYKEEKWCEEDFISLEEAGVIHRTSQLLVKEIQQFLIDPSAWINDSNRKAVIQNFSEKYALSDDKWWKSWRTYLKHLKYELKLNIETTN
ncbi:transferase [Candidatus Pseudothioglobus singularis]|nr:transferase [Candidatus Pseudothioglobus singularis]